MRIEDRHAGARLGLGVEAAARGRAGGRGPRHGSRQADRAQHGSRAQHCGRLSRRHSSSRDFPTVGECRVQTDFWNANPIGARLQRASPALYPGVGGVRAERRRSNASIAMAPERANGGISIRFYRVWFTARAAVKRSMNQAGRLAARKGKSRRRRARQVTQRQTGIRIRPQ